MKRKFITVFLIIVLMIPSLVNAERWAKGFNFTFPKFMEMYNSAPTKIYGEPVPLYFLAIGASGYRNVYYAEVKPMMEVCIFSEDNTDKVVNFVISLKIDNSIPYIEQYAAGQKLSYIMGAAAFAVGGGKLRDPMKKFKEEFGFPTELLFENNLMEYDDKGITYALNRVDDSILLSIRLTEVYASKDEFMAYRDATMPKNGVEK